MIFLLAWAEYRTSSPEENCQVVFFLAAGFCFAPNQFPRLDSDELNQVIEERQLNLLGTLDLFLPNLAPHHPSLSSLEVTRIGGRPF